MRWTASIVALLSTIVLAPSAAAAGSEYDWPLLPRPVVTRAFDKPDHNWLPGHRGVDLAGVPGQAVLSAGPGVVVYAGSVATTPVVTVAHAGGLRTTYEPVRASVSVGARVTRGSQLGTLLPGHPDCPAAACLHWGLIRRDTGDDYLDPLGLLHLTPLRLKPLNER